MAIHKAQERLAAYAFGVTFVSIMLAVAIAIPYPSPFQYEVFKIVLALAAAGVAAFIPGFLTVTIASVDQKAAEWRKQATERSTKKNN